MKKEPSSRYFLNPTFQFTDDEESLEYKVLSGEHFPRSGAVESKSINTAWIRYFHCNSEFFYIPKQYKYMNAEVLTAVLNGKLIDTGAQHVEVGEMVDLTKL